MAQATIILELFKSGIHLTCDDTGHDEFIPRGDGNTLVEVLNNIQDITDPDAIWSLTEKGKYLTHLMDDEGMTFEEASRLADEKFD